MAAPKTYNMIAFHGILQTDETLTIVAVKGPGRLGRRHLKRVHGCLRFPLGVDALLRLMRSVGFQGHLDVVGVVDAPLLRAVEPSLHRGLRRWTSGAGEGVGRRPGSTSSKQKSHSARRSPYVGGVA